MIQTLHHRRSFIVEEKLSEKGDLNTVKIFERLPDGKLEPFSHLTGGITAEKAIIYLTVNYPGCKISLG